MQWKYMETVKYIDYTRINKYRFSATKIVLCGLDNQYISRQNGNRDGKNIKNETKMINKREDLKKGRCRGLKEKC